MTSAEPNHPQPQQVATLLQQTLVPQLHQQAEQQLQQWMTQYPLPMAQSLLQFMTTKDTSTSTSTLLAATLLLKNHLKQCWLKEDVWAHEPQLQMHMRHQLLNALPLLIQSVHVNAVIVGAWSDLVAWVAEQDFPLVWPTFLQEWQVLVQWEPSLVGLQANVGLLQVVHVLFKR